MDRKTKWLLSWISILSFFAIAAGVGLSKRQSRVTGEMVPPEFGQFSRHFLIIRNDSAWNKMAQKAFEENYTGRFSFVNLDELETKYPDTLAYRFYLSRDLFNGPEDAGTGTLWIFDRVKSKKYYSNRTQYFEKLLRSYSIELEKARR